MVSHYRSLVTLSVLLETESGLRSQYLWSADGIATALNALVVLHGIHVDRVSRALRRFSISRRAPTLSRWPTWLPQSIPIPPLSDERNNARVAGASHPSLSQTLPVRWMN